MVDIWNYIVCGSVLLLPTRIRQEHKHLLQEGFHTLQVQVDEQKMEDFGQGFIQRTDNFFNRNIHNNSNDMVREKELIEMGFEREYPLYKMGDITLYAYDDDDRTDIYYMIDERPISDRASFPYDKSIRIRTVEQLKQLINERKG